MTIMLDELTQEQYKKLVKLYWVQDHKIEPAFKKSMHIWYGWRATGKNPPPDNELIDRFCYWRRPTFAEACRRQHEWDQWNVNYIHWHWKMEDKRPFPKETVLKYRGRTVYEINRDNILFARGVTATSWPRRL